VWQLAARYGLQPTPDATPLNPPSDSISDKL